MAAQAQIPSEQKETREKTISHTSLQKTQNKEFLSINACYSVTKYYLCRQNNKRSLLGRKQQSQVARSFPNRYLFSYTNKVTSLFSISCILDIILHCKKWVFVLSTKNIRGTTTLLVLYEHYVTANRSPRNWQSVSSRMGGFIVPAYMNVPTK